MSITDTSNPGIDPDRLASWLTDHTALDGPYAVEHLSGGRSNLTYRLTAAQGTFVVRRPPLGQVPSSAHDMSREWRFLQALSDTDVPVPTPIAFCKDRNVVGADFYVMSFAAGRVLATGSDSATLSPKVRRHAAEATVDTLVMLHTLDPDLVGLTEFRRSGSFIERQLHRWHAQVHRVTHVDLRLVDEAHAALLRRIPPEATRIVHGDFRPGNLVYDSTGAVVAVLDWELGAIGEPLTDLGWLLASWEDPSDLTPAIIPGPTGAAGFPGRQEIAKRYCAQTGRDVETVHYHLAFARWRAACIAVGVASRYAAGQMGDASRDGSDELRIVEIQARAALDLLSDLD